MKNETYSTFDVITQLVTPATALAIPKIPPETGGMKIVRVEVAISKVVILVFITAYLSRWVDLAYLYSLIRLLHSIFSSCL
jgi:hypothetical protein